MRRLRNVFSCLVHEESDCVMDLARNLRCLDPGSSILLFNGGEDTGLFDRLPLSEVGAVVHPCSAPVTWGRMHEYALESMRFALDLFNFDTLTFVDSDQLLLRSGYSECLTEALAGADKLGLLGDFTEYPHGPVPPETKRSSPRSAHWEIDLWQPFLRRFPHGEERFPYWSIFGATVYTAPAARALVNFFDSDGQLRATLEQSRIHATEEVVLPSLVALLGYELRQSPCSYELMKWRAEYTAEQVESSFNLPGAFWIHPVRREYDNIIRSLVRQRFAGYTRTVRSGVSS